MEECLGDNGGCSAPNICVIFHCEAPGFPCPDDQNCGPGNVCHEGGCFQEGFPCDTTDECWEGAQCLGGICAAAGLECLTEAGCAEGLTCLEGICVEKPCTLDWECWNDFGCYLGICVPAVCNGDSQCAEGEVCLGYQCITWDDVACETDEECLPGNTLCYLGKCFQASGDPCEVESDCPLSEDCKFGQCVPDLVAPTCIPIPDPAVTYAATFQPGLDCDEPVFVDYDVHCFGGGTTSATTSSPDQEPYIAEMSQGCVESGEVVFEVSWTITDHAGHQVTSAATWTVDLNPQILSVDPPYGRPGDTVIIHGHNFTLHPLWPVTLHMDGVDEMISPCWFSVGADAEWKVTVPSYAKKGLLEHYNPEMGGTTFQWDMDPTVPVTFVVNGPPPGSGNVYIQYGPMTDTAPQFALEPDGLLQWTGTFDLTVGETFQYSYFDGTAWYHREHTPDVTDLIGTARVLQIGAAPMVVHDRIYGWEAEDQGYAGRLDYLVLDSGGAAPLMQSRALAGGRIGVSDHEGHIVLEGIEPGPHTVTILGPDRTWTPVTLNSVAIVGDPEDQTVVLEQPPLVTVTLQATMPSVEEGHLVPELTANLEELPGPFDGFQSTPFLEEVAPGVFEIDVTVPEGFTLWYRYNIATAGESRCDGWPVAHRLLVTEDLDGQTVTDEVVNYNGLWETPDTISVARIDAYVPINTPPDTEVAANLAALIEVEPHHWRRDIPGNLGQFAFSMNHYPLYGLGEDCGDDNYPACHPAITIPWNEAFVEVTYYVPKWRWHPAAPLSYPEDGVPVEVDLWVTVPETPAPTSLVLYGDVPALGGGDPSAGVALQQLNAHTWTGTIALPAMEEVTFFLARDGAANAVSLPRGFVTPIFDGQPVLHNVVRWSDEPQPGYPARAVGWRNATTIDFTVPRYTFPELVDHLAASGYTFLTMLGPTWSRHHRDPDLPAQGAMVEAAGLGHIAQGELSMFEGFPDTSDGLMAEEWDAHFEIYARRQRTRAMIAATAGADWMEIQETPVFKASTAPSPDALDQWQTLIEWIQDEAGLSVLCKGGAYWMNADNNFVWDPPDDIAPFCDALRISMACELSPGVLLPTVEEMQPTAAALLEDYLHPVADGLSKPVVLEVSYSAYEGAHTWLYIQDDYAPWCPFKEETCPDPADRPPVSLQHQADIYEAILRVAAVDAHVTGIGTWGYWPMGHTPENGFVSIRDKPAEEVFRKYALAAFILDVDGDGMDDAWESAHGCVVGISDGDADPDGDQIPALEAFYLAR